MSEDKKQALPEGLVEHLVRSYASGQTKPEPTSGFQADENDVAAFVRGDLLPPRLTAFQKALLQDQDLRAAVDFERQIWGQDLAIRRRSRWGLRTAAAAAAIVLVSVIGWNAYQASSGSTDAPGTSPTASVIAEATQLETARNQSLEQLTAALSRQEMTELAKIGVMRSTDSVKSRFAGPAGAILSTRPVIIIDEGQGALAIRLFAADEAFRHIAQWKVPATQQSRSLLTLPADTRDLKRGPLYGLEISDHNGKSLGTRSFVIAKAESASMIEEALATIDAKYATEGQVEVALRKASLLTKEKYYFDAMCTLDSTPKGDRSANAIELLSGLRKLMNLP